MILTGTTCEVIILDREQVKKLFKFLASIYPNFVVSSHKLNVWARMMKDMDYKRVMAKAEQHAIENKFPPTVAEIAAYAPEENKHLEQMREWQREAEQVPDHVKQQFRQKMIDLIQEKSQ